MKSSLVYIKANYIKKAKGEWIYCDAQIIKQKNVAMLKLSSVGSINDEKDDTQSRISNFSNVSTICRPKVSSSVSLKVLCNLSEFKSCEIKPINFNEKEKFAIKLIPSGILNSKKLYFVPEFEEDVTKWCSLLGDHIYRQKEMENRSQRNTDFRDNDLAYVKRKDSISKDEYSTIKSKREVEIKVNNNIENEVSTLKSKQNIFEVNKHNEERRSTTSNSPTSSNSNKAEEIYFAMDDNDVYESSCSENIYTVCVEETHDSQKIGIRGSYLMKVKQESIELCDIRKGETIHEFPYIFIRRFGAKNDLLRLEAGRKCSTGEGYFVFRFKDAGKACITIKQLVKELKLSSMKVSQMTDAEDSISNRNSVAMSTNSASFECNVDTVDNKNKSNVSMQSNGNTKTNTLPIPQSSQSLSFSSSHSSSNNIPRNTPSSKPPLHPLYNSVNSIQSGIQSSNVSVTNSVRSTMSPPPSRLPVINNSFSRNQYASSFSYRRPSQVNIPVVKDDSFSRSAIYDNIPPYEIPVQNGGTLSRCSPSRSSQNSSNVKFTSTYSMQSPLTNATKGQYDNIPNNQRCIKELESMLMDLGIETN